jgi:DNA repair protein SbcD/Mre11
MIFSHISDTHLGLVQYGAEEREQDVFSSFNQAIDTSIKDHVSFVIFAGDIFHVPNPSGTAILQMANALKRLKEYNIDSFFILGEHDISRIRSTPIPYVYHNLEFSKYIGQGQAVKYKDILLAGFDKMRKSEIPNFEKKLADIDSIAKNHSGHKILVMHQGITEFNKFAGELLSTDLPKNFTYYAMGHLHDHDIKQFNHLSGPVVYPGSLELTTSEGIKETKKGFYEVDISTAEAKSNWIEVDTRPQFSFKMDYDNIAKTIDDISQKILKFERKPIIELKISGEKIEPDLIQAQISRLNPHSLRCFWKIINNEKIDSSIYFEKPNLIDEELFKLSINALGSEQNAYFAVKELLPLLSSKQLDDATQLVIENFHKYKKRKQK